MAASRKDLLQRNNLYWRGRKEALCIRLTREFFSENKVCEKKKCKNRVKKMKEDD